MRRLARCSAAYHAEDGGQGIRVSIRRRLDAGKASPLVVAHFGDMEATGVGLGTASLFFQVYDNCKRLYTGYETLRHFGKDMRLLHARLKVAAWDLDTLMETKTNEMRRPPDLNDRNHPVTKEILEHLRIILTYFQNCNKIIATTFSTLPACQWRLTA